MRSTGTPKARFARLFAAVALLGAFAAAATGCQTTQDAWHPPAAQNADTTSSLPIASANSWHPSAVQNADTVGSLPIASADHPADAWRQQEGLRKQYRAEPDNLNVALRYAQALRTTGQRAQAVAVLQKASIQHPQDKRVLGAYGRALAEAGDYDQALAVLGRAHTPDQPDWHILSAQGAVLDQMGRHTEAQRYYLTALKIVPDKPSVLSNLGLSYALSKDLKDAEATLRRAAAQRPVDPRVRQNLALVVGLQGRFAEAETIARADLPTDEAAANVAYLRHMLAHPKDLHEPKRDARTADGAS